MSRTNTKRDVFVACGFPIPRPALFPSIETSPRSLHICSTFTRNSQQNTLEKENLLLASEDTHIGRSTLTDDAMLRSISLISAMSLLCAAAQDVQPPFNCINNAPSLLSSCGGELEVAGQVVPLNVTTAATVR